MRLWRTMAYKTQIQMGQINLSRQAKCLHNWLGHLFLPDYQPNEKYNVSKILQSSFV